MADMQLPCAFAVVAAVFAWCPGRDLNFMGAQAQLRNPRVQETAMLATDVIELARITRRHLAEHGEDAGLIVAMSKDFGQQMAKDLMPEAFNDGAGAEPDEIAGMPVVYKDGIEDPVVITTTGKIYSLLPEWARKERMAEREMGLILKPVV